MRVVRSLGVSVLLLVLVSACASSAKALAPTEDALAATSTAILAFEQFQDDSTIATVTITTLEDSLDAVADAESEISALPARADAIDIALAAVRDSSDAIASALYLVQTSRGEVTDAAAALESARTTLDAAVTRLKADR
jgi:hypothetical protein